MNRRDHGAHHPGCPAASPGNDACGRCNSGACRTRRSWIASSRTDSTAPGTTSGRGACKGRRAASPAGCQLGHRRLLPRMRAGRVGGVPGGRERSAVLQLGRLQRADRLWRGSLSGETLRWNDPTGAGAPGRQPKSVGLGFGQVQRRVSATGWRSSQDHGGDVNVVNRDQASIEISGTFTGAGLGIRAGSADQRSVQGRGGGADRLLCGSVRIPYDRSRSRRGRTIASCVGTTSSPAEPANTALART